MAYEARDRPGRTACEARSAALWSGTEIVGFASVLSSADLLGFILPCLGELGWTEAFALGHYAKQECLASSFTQAMVEQRLTTCNGH